MGPRAKREDDSCGEVSGDVPITTSDQDHENALEEDHDQRHSFIANSGNVFADLNVKNPEEALAKAKLVQQIGAIIRQKKLSQTAAAEICGVDQPKISKLRKGELYGFSTDQLLRFLTAFGR